MSDENGTDRALASAVESMTRMTERLAEEHTALVSFAMGATKEMREQGQADLASRIALASRMLDRLEKEAKEDEGSPEMSEETTRKLVEFLTGTRMGAATRDVVRVVIRHVTAELDRLDALDAAKAAEATPAAAT